MTAASGVCRGCGGGLGTPFLDLGSTPLANSYLRSEDLLRGETFYPLQVFVCRGCFLVQLPAVQTPEEIFGDYAYFSSFSTAWLKHVEEYSERMIGELGVSGSSLVVEIASNDGYLLQFFHRRGIPVLGIEPARNVAEAARKAGIPTLSEFFGSELAGRLVREGKQADLLIGNNVLAHVPALNDFVEGLRVVLKPRGLLTLEFPHLLRLMAESQFDTVYHEHLSYLSLATAAALFERHGLRVVDVEELWSHGGSLRLHVRHREDDTPVPGDRVARLIAAERAAGLMRADRYEAFAQEVAETKRSLLEFLIGAKREGKSIVGYGAPAKGNTLLNYCGVGTDFLDYTVDRSPHKQGLFLPGTRIPIHAPERITETKPDYVLILPWNLKDEIADQMRMIRAWGGRFVVPIPRAQVV